MHDTDSISACPAVRMGELAPNFTARSTEGMITLSEFRGHWLIFFSHPGDFTPVCTSEFIAISKAMDRFNALNCKLLGHSVDSLFSHLAWVRVLHDDLGVVIPFPIVEDPTLEIARAYGMVARDANDASSCRAAYYIDPEGYVRAMTSYPLSVGRSVDEMLRTMAAIQRTQDGSAMTPEGWTPGDDILVTPQYRAADALKTERATEWFYKTQKDSRT